MFWYGVAVGGFATSMIMFVILLAFEWKITKDVDEVLKEVDELERRVRTLTSTGFYQRDDD